MSSLPSSGLGATAPANTLSSSASPTNAADSDLSSPPTPSLLRLSAAGADLATDDYGVEYNFKSHPTVVTFLSLFQYVNLVAVEVTLTQSSVVCAPSGAKDSPPAITSRFRSGIVPRGLVPYEGPSKAITGMKTGSIPHLHMFQTSTNLATSQVLRFGAGGIPFPPGVQLDLRAVEIRGKYACFGLYPMALPVAGAASSLIKVQLDFVVSYSTPGFGA